MNILRLITATGAALLSSHSASATVVITEFMSDPAGTDTAREFVELYNSGGSAVDLTGWILKDEDSAGATLPAISIGAGNFIIVARNSTTFIAEWAIPANLQSSVIQASFSLVNGDDELVLQDSTPSNIWSLAYNSGIASGESAYLDPGTTLTSGTAFGTKAAPGVDLTMAGDYINQGVTQEAEAVMRAPGIGSPFAWNGVSQIPEPSSALLVALAGGFMVIRRKRNQVNSKIGDRS